MIVIGRDTENPDQSNLQCFGPQRSVERGPHTHTCTHTFSPSLYLSLLIFLTYTLFLTLCVASLSLYFAHTLFFPRLSLFNSLVLSFSLCNCLSFSHTDFFSPQIPHSYRFVSVNVSLSSTHSLFLGLCDISLFVQTHFPGVAIYPLLFLLYRTHKLFKKKKTQQAAWFPLNTQLSVF